jgi:hypothetical protein
MFLSYVSRTAPIAALVLLGVGVLGVDRWSGIAAQSGPPAPSNLTASVDGSTVALSWSSSASGVLYQLEAGSRAGAADLVVTRMGVTSAVATNVPDGTYFVRVRAGNGSGVSRPSNELTVRVGCTNSPAAPAGLAVQVSGTTVALTWQKSSSATGYVLEAGSAPGQANIATAPVKGTSLTTTAPPGVYYARVRATNKCGSSAPSNEVTVSVGGGTPAPAPTPTPTPTAGAGSIFGIVDPAILGSCTAATHDKWVVDGGDGFKYRTWHPQTDPTGCVYAHEHGDNPASIQEPTIAASPVRFGYIGRRMQHAGEPNGHEEPHEGFKVFIANRGDVNDEGRVNRVYSRSVFHMGTGGPRRFNMPHHSAEIRLVHPEFGLKAFTQLMMDTGGVGAVCDPRVQAPVKDVMQLNSPCKLNSGYEIWSTQASVYAGGREVYRAFATPAVFDPITVFNPANPTELVYTWDARMAASKTFPGDNWSGNRGCDRESYAQPGYWYNGGGPTTYYTDAHGQPLAASNPLALRQEISASNSVGSPATTDGLHQFKMRKGFCQQRAQLGLKN